MSTKTMEESACNAVAFCTIRYRSTVAPELRLAEHVEARHLGGFVGLLHLC